MTKENINNFFAALDGATKGGCDKCDAEMELQNRFGIWHMTIKHDDWCPVLRRHNSVKRNRPKDSPETNP